MQLVSNLQHWTPKGLPVEIHHSTSATSFKSLLETNFYKLAVFMCHVKLLLCIIPIHFAILMFVNMYVILLKHHITPNMYIFCFSPVNALLCCF